MKSEESDKPPLPGNAARHTGFVFSGRTVEGQPLSRREPDAQSQSPASPAQRPQIAADGIASSAGAYPAARPTLNAGQYRVLVGEDHAINLRLVAALLQAAGCEARCVQNGRQVLAEFDIADFDLIIMDSQMPVMTGIEAIAAIRSRCDWKRFIPILSLTAHAMKGAEEYHTLAGADLYMSKPLRGDCFIGAVNRLAGRGRELCARQGTRTSEFRPPANIQAG